MNQQKFLQTLFDTDQVTCFAPDGKGTTVKQVPAPEDVFFSINALSPVADLDPSEAYHSPDKPRRADANVVCHRNFLIELDKLPLKQQIDYVRSKVPVTAITFSGNKSYHFIISLEEPVSAQEYSRIANGLLRLLPEADRTTKNPSRLSRLPGVVRPDTKLLQELIYLGSRIKLADLPEFPPAPQHYERTEDPVRLFVSDQLRKALSAPDQFMQGRFSGRNQFFYWVGKRCSELNYTKAEKKLLVERFYDKLQEKRGFSIKEAYMAARVKL